MSDLCHTILLSSSTCSAQPTSTVTTCKIVTGKGSLNNFVRARRPGPPIIDYVIQLYAVRVRFRIQTTDFWYDFIDIIIKFLQCIFANPHPLLSTCMLPMIPGGHSSIYITKPHFDPLPILSPPPPRPTLLDLFLQISALGSRAIHYDVAVPPCTWSQLWTHPLWVRHIM